MLSSLSEFVVEVSDCLCDTDSDRGSSPLNVVSSHLNITDLLSWKLGWARLLLTSAKGPDPPTHGSVLHRTVSRSC